MNFWKITFVFLFSTFLLVSCNKAESAITDLNDVITAIDELPDEYTEQDLQNIIADYDAVKEELKKYEYTDEQMQEIGELQGKYAAKITKASMKIVGKSLEKFSKQIEGAMKGFQEEMDKE